MEDGLIKGRKENTEFPLPAPRHHHLALGDIGSGVYLRSDTPPCWPIPVFSLRV